MKINLLPLARQRQPHRYRAIALLALGVLCVSAPLVYYSYQQRQGLESLRNEEARLIARVAALSPLDPLLQEYVSLEQELARIKGEAVPTQAKLVPFLDEVARLLPDRVFVEELALEEARLSLRGVTPTYALAAEFLRVLAGSELFADPVLSVLHRGDAGYSFDIAVELRAVVP
ncbi:MAG: hypothetical protein DDT38_01200 [Firmicutes bacterium]|nr:hypothetical protein [candidate division NPL-UPA2 bacterium]